jgi:hypothetical protein
MLERVGICNHLRTIKVLCVKINVSSANAVQGMQRSTLRIALFKKKLVAVPALSVLPFRAKAMQEEIMETETPAPAAPEFSPEALELIEAHRVLMARYRIPLASENDSYSLAQPSPYPFVPSVASDGTYPLLQGE